MQLSFSPRIKESDCTIYISPVLDRGTRRALQQLALNVHVKHSDLTSYMSENTDRESDSWQQNP